MRFISSLALIAAAAVTVGTARADQASQPSGVITLAASASVDVAKDLLTIGLGTTKEGTDAATVQSQLKTALDAALAEAKKAAKPGQVDVRTGNFSLSPRYDQKGVVNGWQGTAELEVEGRDMQAIAQLTGRIKTLTISRVGYSLSRELREKSEADLTGEAIATYRARATDYAKAFGYAGYTIREVNIGGNEPPPGVPRPMMRMMAAAPAAAQALPIEAGNDTVTITVSGTVQLTR